jgi:DNA repair exonuclease SbcCD ATPase subunit
VVDEEHAEQEHRRLASEVGRVKGELDEAKTEDENATEAKRKAEQRRDWLASLFLLAAQLPDAWRQLAADHDTAAVHALEGERTALSRSGVIDAFRKLEQDEALRTEWAEQLANVEKDINDIPRESQIPVADAERLEMEAKKADADADAARDKAKDYADDLARREKKHRELAEQIAEAERQARLHRKLDDRLGKGGLQRELVRTAEREIVRLANDTVQNLSDGDLAIELDDGADSSDEAFALRVRRADSPTPIGVSFLSGSQKFRVAIAVALAIGRYAAGQARPLESVIIDEGFGSLDRDGLRAAADELNRLRQHLRRIVLVSHQEEFADRFPVVIRLRAGENGTTADEPWRQ